MNFYICDLNPTTLTNSEYKFMYVVHRTNQHIVEIIHFRQNLIPH